MLCRVVIFAIHGGTSHPFQCPLVLCILLQDHIKDLISHIRLAKIQVYVAH